MKKTLNQKKKELFELLVQYYETKPEDSWCTGAYSNGDGTCCGIGHIRADFQPYGLVERTVTKLTGLSYNLIDVNDGKILMYQQPTPKQRVLAYLNDEINKL